MEKTWKPTAAGILAIVAGVLNLIVGIVIVAVGSAFLGPFIGLGWLGAIGAPLIILGIVSIVGGVFALRRRIWGLALAGAICALFPPPIAILGILSIIFLAISTREFT
jgi:hypothetical protein